MPSVTQRVNFEPSSAGPFQFQPTLDGQTYIAVVRWNIFGRRYYMALSSLDGTLIVNIPLIGSPHGTNFSLVAGYFTDQLVFRQSSQQFQVITTRVRTTTVRALRRVV